MDFILCGNVPFLRCFLNPLMICSRYRISSFDSHEFLTITHQPGLDRHTFFHLFISSLCRKIFYSVTHSGQVTTMQSNVKMITVDKCILFIACGEVLSLRYKRTVSGSGFIGLYRPTSAYIVSIVLYRPTSAYIGLKTINRKPSLLCHDHLC